MISIVRVAACAAIAVSISLMVGILLAGPSPAVPVVGPDAPPWSLALRPPGWLVWRVAWAATIMGAAGTGLALYALDRGWRPSPGALFAAGGLACAILAVLPVAGSTDVLNYAVYGRIAVLGHDPYVLTARDLLDSGDPVGALAPSVWRDVPSVYGPLGTWVFALGARLGGASMAHIAFALKVVEGIAFLLTAATLDRMAGPDLVRRARVHILWTANPLLLWCVVAGGHLDGVAACLMVGALWLARRSALAGGVLLGAAAAVKLPYALAGAGFVWGWRRAVVGAAGVLALVYWLAGPAALRAVRDKATGLSEIDPWRVPLQLAGLSQWNHEGLAAGLALVAAALLTGALLWRLPPGQPAVRVALAVCVAWAVTSPLQRPWYDALVFPLLALMPATRLSWLLLIQLAAANLAHLPGVAMPGWPLPWMRHVLIPWVTPSIILATVAGLFVVLALPARSRSTVDVTVPYPRRPKTPMTPVTERDHKHGGAR